MNRRLFLLGLGALPACTGKGLRSASTRRIEQPDHGQASPLRKSLARPGEVPVLLVSARGREELAIVDTSRGATTFVRAGDRVMASDGRVETELDLAPRSARSGLALDGQTYAGRFVISPRAAGGLEVINIVDIEDYVEGVVAAELAIWSAEPAELAAQAICVRTYALSTLAKRGQTTSRAVLFDTILDQAYRGRHRPGDSEKARQVARKLRDSVEASRGQVMMRRGRLEDARFHAACGGRTAELPRVFSGASAGPPPVACPPCLQRAAAERAAGSPDPSRPLGWSRTFGPAELKAAAQALDIGPRLERLQPIETDRGGRWLVAEVQGPSRSREVHMDELRAAFGSTHYKSALIEASTPAAGSIIHSSLLIHGRGRGHGVGLCQEGARDLARAGYSFHRILSHYYPGSQIERLR